MLAPARMDTPQKTTPESAYTDGRSISGKMFVIIFMAIAVTLASIVTFTRVNVRPKYEAAVASSSAKVFAAEAKSASVPAPKPAESAK
jgi:hypothetical protein